MPGKNPYDRHLSDRSGDFLSGGLPGGAGEGV